MADDRGLKNLLREGAGEFGLVLGDEKIDLFFKYKGLLKEWNKKFNLTAIEDDADIIAKHFLDSLSILPYFKNEKLKIIDIGTGAGFPGIPAKIVYDNIRLTLLDSLEKKISFLKEVKEALGFKNDVLIIHGRAEDMGILPEYREIFDISAARAVAALPVLLEYCLPFVKTGGIFIAMKGNREQSAKEAESSKKALEILGGKIEEIKETVIPSTDIKRNIIIIKKYRHTPAKYPRKAGKPAKKPLD